MKSSPYENSPYTSDVPTEEFTQPLPPPPSLPAEGRESVLALILALLCAFTANSFLFGGLALGSALGIFGIFTATALYLLVKTKRFGWYSLSCLACSLILVASFPRSNDGTVKFFLLLLAFTAYLLGLSQIIWAPYYPAGRIQSLNGAGRALFLTPYPQIFSALRGLFAKQTPDGVQRRRIGGVLLGLLLAVPALAIILPLLIRSDAAFEGLVGRSILIDIAELIPTLLFGFLLFLPVYARPVALCQDADPPIPSTKPGRLQPVTLNTFLGVVVFVYLLYLVSQLAYFFSAFEGILPDGYTQAEYARRGFFEMSALCSINLLMGILSISQVRRNPAVPRLTRFLCLFILVFSLVLAACSASKMGMYIGVYGLTRLRVLTSLFMICVAVALVCVAVWILIPRFPYMQVTLLTALVVGCCTGWMDVDTQVAKYNVDAYLSGQLDTVDVEHLGCLSEGAIPQLARLLEAQEPQVQKEARATLAGIIQHYYHVERENGTVTLDPWDDQTLRSWTWTQSQALPLLESLAPALDSELPR